MSDLSPQSGAKRTLISTHSKSRWKSPPGTLPTGVAVIEGADSASIAGAVVMVNVPLKPERLRLSRRYGFDVHVRAQGTGYNTGHRAQHRFGF
jgi:hypothetical protein